MPVSFLRPLCLCAWFLIAAASAGRAEGWEETVPRFSPGAFAEPRAMRAQYNFGWSGMTAATAELHFWKTADARFQLDGTAETVGMARTLWKFEVHHESISDGATLRPIRVNEVEVTRSKRWDTEVNYSAERVISRRTEERDGTSKTKSRTFEFPNVHSLNSALLYLRSKSLTDGTVDRTVVYPANTAYLCTITVLGHERINVPPGAYEAIKLDLKLDKIGKKRELLPHKKFKRATVWLSNDADRLILRIEARMFIGTVFAELQSVQFENGK